MDHGITESVDQDYKWMATMMENNLIEVKTRVPERAMRFINQLVARGYYSSVADFARQSILDKLVNDFELGISELEPDLVEVKPDDNRIKNNKLTHTPSKSGR